MFASQNYSNVVGSAPVSYGQTYGAPTLTTMAAPMQTIQTMAAPMTTMAAPFQTYGAPMTTMIAAQPAVEIDRVNAYGQVVERDFVQQTVAPRNLLAMGNVVSERVISIEELASMDRYTAVEAVMVQAPREMIIERPMVEYVQQAPMVEYVQAAPAVEYIQQPAVEYIQAPQAVEYITQAPQTFIGSAPLTTMAAPQTFIGSMAAPQMTYGTQMATMAPQMTYGAPMTTMMAPQTFLG